MASSRVHQSCVLPFKVVDVWSTIGDLSFEWLNTVLKCKLEDGAHRQQVGATRTLVYEGDVKQVIKVLELSELHYTMTWEVISSEPAVSYSSAVHTIICRRVTKDNSTFIEWISDFSNDAKLEVLQDMKFKQLDAFTDLEEFLDETFGEDEEDFEVLVNTGIADIIPKKQRRESSMLKAEDMDSKAWEAQLAAYQGKSVETKTK